MTAVTLMGEFWRAERMLARAVAAEAALAETREVLRVALAELEVLRDAEQAQT